MSALLERIADAFFSVVTFFSNLSVSRYDDPLIAEYKRRKIACIVSTSILLIVPVVMFVMASGLETVQANSILSALADGVRAPLAYGFLAVFTAASVYAAYSYFALWRFLRDGGSFDS